MTQRQAKKLLRKVAYISRTDHPRMMRALSKNFRAYHRYLNGGCRRFKWGASENSINRQRSRPSADVAF